MIERFGKDVFESLDEILRPPHTALVVLEPRQSAHAVMASRLFRLVSAARAAGVCVVWVSTLSPVYGEQHGADYSLPETLLPWHGELVLTKTTLNTFISTGLALTLRGLGKRTVLTAGMATEGSVESTAEGAAHRDFYSVVAEDCTASLSPAFHEDALAILRMRVQAVDSERIISIWE
ncbi:isochorismatase family protein [Microbacterium sp.]|uniref:cysteine hydrolase family protein n=1 Tax=Microbacterium sp. TaxID=51671 RepID=UPI00281150CD|nr:isochorismatase family protein [Microbacterium sp.]